MMSNGPLTRFSWLRRAMYRSYPDDLRPSRLATLLAHGGTALEIAVPLAFVLTPGGTQPLVAVALMLLLHTFITCSVPMGVPIEWNFMVVYAGFALFWAHPAISAAPTGPCWLSAFLLTMTVALPLLGNLFPRWISFLVSMRYYAGNWPFSIYLFRGESFRKLRRLRLSSPWVFDQLEMFYPRATAVAVVGKVMGFRLMHLQGRLISALLPTAVDRLENYEWMDGEIIAGMVLGWNFGDGHLHQEQLLSAIQAQCGFEEGELRCIFGESQPLGRSTLEWRVVDAKSGTLAAGETSVERLLALQPWEA
jgi:hypothetical protein